MAEKLRILIAEDEAIIAFSLRMEVEFSGHKILAICSNANEVIDKAKSEEVDVILMDINLNGDKDGIQAAHEILAVKDVKIIFMTGFGEKIIRDRAMELSPTAFMNKPIDMDYLITILEDIAVS